MSVPFFALGQTKTASTPDRSIRGRSHAPFSFSLTATTGTAPLRQPQRKRGLMPPKAKSSGGRNPHHLTKAKVPVDARKLKRVFEIHIRLMWGLLSQNAIPELPSNELMERFRQRYASAEVVVTVFQDLRRDFTAEMNVMIRARKLRTDAALVNGDIATAITSIDTSLLAVAISMHVQVGLEHFRPDLLGGAPDDPYNMLHEISAIKSFTILLTTGAYLDFKANMTRAEDVLLLRGLFRNFVFSYIRKKVVLERKTPGAAAILTLANDIYRRRKRLSDARVSWIRQQGFSSAMESLFEEPECNSDDEATVLGGTTVYIRNGKEHRDPSLDELLHSYIDPERIKTVALTQSRRSLVTERERVEHPDAPHYSKYGMHLPPSCALDWFNPETHPQSVTTFANPPLLCRSWSSVRYGNAVKARYNLPTKAEMERIRAAMGKEKEKRERREFFGDDDNGSDGDDGDGNGGDDDDDMGGDAPTGPKPPSAPQTPSKPGPPGSSSSAGPSSPFRPGLFNSLMHATGLAPRPAPQPPISDELFSQMAPSFPPTSNPSAPPIHTLASSVVFDPTAPLGVHHEPIATSTSEPLLPSAPKRRKVGDTGAAVARNATAGPGPSTELKCKEGKSRAVKKIATGGEDAEMTPVGAAASSGQ
uniref:Uncharacterized protein n=1 Tax=Mycena chlorophos TaxID=658473 RepID=A0ABQ0L8P2_MYCCL|nr:predicted protein [Mycena chlorophos]